MGIQDLQSFLESPHVSAGSVPVDLLRIARGVAQRQARQQQRGGKNTATQHASNKLSLVVDGECCLDRLYGGYFSDWACGGQWNRMVQFLAVLIQTVQTSHIELAVFFNGCLEQQRMSEWITGQMEVRKKINQVLKHINTKGTPPPKVWWTSPVCLRTCLRMALRHLNVSVVEVWAWEWTFAVGNKCPGASPRMQLCTMDDHHQEVIAYCRENGFHGLMADDGEYAVFDPPRYFSSEHLKLTYKGSLETKEYILSEVAKGLGLTADRFCVLAALLGNYLLPEQDLMDFYRKLGMSQVPGKIPADILVKTVAGFVKTLSSIDNLDAVAIQVFGSPLDKRAAKLKQSVQYYLNGTKDGFLRYRPQATGKRSDPHFGNQAKPINNNGKVKNSEQMDTSKFASETAESERDSLAAYNEATANAKKAPQIVIEPPTVGGLQGDANKISHKEDLVNCETKNHIGGSTEDESNAGLTNSHTINGGNSNLLISSSSSSSSSSATSPSRLTPEVGWNVQTAKPGVGADDASKHSSLPSIPPEVLRTASERHQKGLMSPFIYQILTQGEIKLPVLMEDENNKEFPSIHLLYRPVRQMVYAILFNLHHYMYLASKNKEKGDGEKCEIPELRVKEWIWSKSNPYQTPDLVKAEQIGWGVPTIQRLWFGSAIDDKRRRLRAFLTCMRSDTPLMLNPAYVPQHLLVMAAVLRYIMSFSDKKILRKPELDAFIAQAFSPELMNAHYLQELQLPLVTSRGVQLAALFMQGVETALLANDACGAPIPWLMCCPWLFFDGKLFHHKLARTGVVKNLLELCDHHIEHVVKVERMRKAVLEGLNVQFARPPLPQLPGTRISLAPTNIMPAGGALVTPRTLPVARGGNGMYPAANGAARGMLRRTVPTRGGQLEIAGVVVGSWGPNYGSRGAVSGPPHAGPIGTGRGVRLLPPQVTSVGGLKTYRQGGTVAGYHVAPTIGPGRPTFHTRGGKVSGGAGRAKKNQTGAGKKKTASGNKKVIHRDSEKGKSRTGDEAESSTPAPTSVMLNKNCKVGSTAENSSPASGQFDDATTLSDSNSSPANAKDADVALPLLDSVQHKGQGDGPLLVGVPTSQN